LIAVGALALAGFGCTEVAGSDVDDVDSETELEQGGALGSPIGDESTSPRDGSRTGDPQGDSAQTPDEFKQTQGGPNISGQDRQDPEPAPWHDKASNSNDT